MTTTTTIVIARNSFFSVENICTQTAQRLNEYTHLKTSKIHSNYMILSFYILFCARFAKKSGSSIKIKRSENRIRKKLKRKNSNAKRNKIERSMFTIFEAIAMVYAVCRWPYFLDMLFHRSCIRCFSLLLPTIHMLFDG